MARTIFGLTLTEGFTDLGSFEVDVTGVEAHKGKVADLPTPLTGNVARHLLFRLQFNDAHRTPVPPKYKAKFSLEPVSGISYQYEHHTNAEGYVQLDTPLLPISVLSPGKTIYTRIEEAVIGREYQPYLEILLEELDTMYTLITDFVVSNGYLCVRKDETTFYKLRGKGTYWPPYIPIPEDTEAVLITPKGEIYTCSTNKNTWVLRETLLFFRFDNPELLSVESDGFYLANQDGNLEEGTLGSGIFLDYSLSLQNPDVFKVSVELGVYDSEDKLVGNTSFDELVPGSYNITTLNDIRYTEPRDTSPTLTTLESKIGSFATLKQFLTNKGLTTIAKVRKAGPIKYIVGYNIHSPSIPDSELNLVQPHIDLYTLNPNIDVNKSIISKGYDNVYTISNTAKSKFVSDTTSTILPLFESAKLHEVVSQNQKFAAVRLAGTLSDYKMETSPTPVVNDSEFSNKVLAKAVNSCGCSDCQSGISPFAYLFDLLRYSYLHLTYKGENDYENKNEADFTNNVLTPIFKQPFGELNVDCSTLHDEYCRVRLVTEVLEREIGTLSQAKQSALNASRNEFLMLVYQSMLARIGTSWYELRNLVSMPAGLARESSVKKLCDKIGIPTTYYNSTSLTYLPTIKRIWLTPGGNGNSELNSDNLQTVFGYRNTLPTMDQISPTPVSLIETWKKAYLRELWTTQDYIYTQYSREGVYPAFINSYKSTWQPIVDPDIMGWEDMTYLTGTVAKKLWQRRMEDTETFLSYYTSSSVSSKSSADLNRRIVRVTNRNLIPITFDEEKIWLELSANTWTVFNILNKSLIGTDTDIILKKSTASATQPALTQPYGNAPKLHFRRVIPVTAGQVTASTSATLNWTDSVIVDRYNDTGAYARLYSTGDTQTFVSGTNLTVTYSGATSVSLSLGSAPSSNFLGGNIFFVYEVEVSLFTTEIPDPVKISTDLLNKNENYTLLTSVNSSINNLTYTVWASTVWPTSIASISSNWEKLKKLYSGIISGNASADYYTTVSNKLHMDVAAFNRMMQLLLACEMYLNATLTSKRPNTEELFEMASIFRNCAKFSLRGNWVEEEIKHDPTGGSNYSKLMLDGKFFWKSLNEPLGGSWDPSLQTLNSNVAIIDPELLPEDSLLNTVEALPYRTLYASRKAKLANKQTDFYNIIFTSPITITGFTGILNEINTGNAGTAPYSALYNISPYAPGNLSLLISDLRSSDPFKKKNAADAAWAAFAISAEDFLYVAEKKELFELNDPALLPNNMEFERVLKILVSGYKRKRFYPNFTLPNNYTGWVSEEMSGTSTFTAAPVKYYNVMKMRLAPGRSNSVNRQEWQKTLAEWNRTPIINPDIVPPEYIINFVAGDIIRDTWVQRKVALDNSYATLAGVIKGTSINTGQLFTNFKAQLDIAIARIDTFTPISNTPYLTYFNQIELFENKREDIRPYVEQLGMTITEYRYLKKIYNLLSATNSLITPPPLLDSEYTDIINILIAIRSRNLHFYQVVEEFNSGVLLSQDGFELYRPMVTGFQPSAQQKFNIWRSPNRLRKEWEETLESRIEREKAISGKLKTDLEEVEEFTMPILRDALLMALAANCETLEDSAERWGKQRLIETRDNCCVKHTRVSFAIETLQGLLFNLSSGVFDEYQQGFELYAPYFKKEWEWLGSYSTWRSAMFVYLYPENLLYPTLRRLQSPAFIKLSQTLQSANRFSAEDACIAAKYYQTYLADVQDMELICSSNSHSYVHTTNFDKCCSDFTVKKDMTFFFGKGKTSGKNYFTSTETNAPNTLKFWEELPVPEKATLLGVYVLGNRNAQYISEGTALWAFYTYSDKDKFKMGYIKKDLKISGSNWTSPSDMPDFPEFLNPNTPSQTCLVTRVIACQQGDETDIPCFIFFYQEGGFDSYYSVVVRYFSKSDTLDIPKNGSNPMYIGPHPSSNLPYSGIKLTIWKNSTTTLPTALWGGFAWLFKGNVVVSAFGTWQGVSWKMSTVNNNLVWAIQSREEPNTIITAEEYNGVISYYRLHIDYANTTNNNPNGFEIFIAKTALSSISNMNDIAFVYPVYCDVDAKDYYYLARTTNNSKIFAELSIPAQPSVVISALDKYLLSPENVVASPAISSTCTLDIKSHKVAVENSMMATLSPNSIYGKPLVISEYLYEGYYFVPMQIALDQQQRGQYESALNWYKVIYDYTEHISGQRKIFYGLTLESNILTTYYERHADDWLLDPLNPHEVAGTRANAYTKYTLTNIIQCLYGYADRLFTLDTIETIPVARKYYTLALDLLKTPELKQKGDACTKTANPCLNTGFNDIDVVNDPQWNVLSRKMSAKISDYGSEAAAKSTVDTVAAIFNNNTTSKSTEQKFAEAFDTIKAQAPAAPAAKTVSNALQDTKNTVNESYQYLSALDDWSSINTAIANDYTASVASISGLKVKDVATNNPAVQPQIEWVGRTLPANKSAYKLSFTNSNGEQNLTGDLLFNPFMFDIRSLLANINFSYAPIFVPYQSGNMVPYTYVPLIRHDFCMPDNPVYKSLTLKGNLELYKIHNCRNIAGMVRELSVYSAPTDSVTGIPVIGASGNLSLPGIGVLAPSQYRFRVLVERAKQLVQQAQQLESLFLAALEKTDAENYSQLQARQGIESAKATVKLQNLRITQANSERNLAGLQLDKVSFIKNHFDTLINNGLNAFEENALYFMIAAEILQYVSATTMLAASMMHFNTSPGMGLSTLGSALGSVSSGLSTRSSYLSTLASHQRRTEEWAYQSNLANHDIGIAGLQVSIADDNVRVVTQERAIAELNVEHAQDSLEYLKSKFTNAELYSWMGSVLERSYSYMLNLATAVAKTAERQLYFERQEQAGPFILDDYWANPTTGAPGSATNRRGLTGSARLLVDITRLDQFAFDSNKRKLQMTKVISLGQNFPSEFQQFRETGVMHFQLTNKLFDYDFPGHYLRLINSVKTSVVGLTPVYDGIKASLTADTISYTVIGGTTFQRIPIRRLELDSVALTSTTNATGLFEMQPAQGELLNPFEGMGVESRWEFKMPQFSNRMDFGNIADILVTVEYTALDNYQYRYQVLQELDNKLSFNRGFSLKNDFPDQWYDLGEAQSCLTTFGATIELKREYFPQGIQELKLNKASDLLLYFVRKDGFEEEIEILDFSYVNPKIIPNPSAPQQYMSGTTDKGKFVAAQLSSILEDSPTVKLQLLFDNRPDTREYFSKGQVKDILLLVPCKAELKAYPL